MNRCFFPCRSSKLSKMMRFVALYILPLLSISFFVYAIVIFIGFWNNIQTINQLIVILVLTTCSIYTASLFLKMSIRCYRLETRAISTGQAGITIKDKNEMFLSWTQIDSIGIIAFGASANRAFYEKQICIFLKPVNKKELKKLLGSYLYGAFNLDRFVLLDYDLFIIEKLKVNSGLPVHNLITAQMKL